MQATQSRQDAVQRTRSSLATFVFGPESLLAYRAASAAAASPGTTINPLYLVGGPGTGKTHLLQAIAHEIARRPGSPEPLYITAEIFSRDAAAATRERHVDALLQRYARAGAFLLDDLTTLNGSAAAQDILLAVITTFQKQHRQIVISADAEPAAITPAAGGLGAALLSGIVARIGKPSLRTRLALARAFAGHARVWFGEDALHLIAYHCTGSVRELQATIHCCAHLATPGTTVDAGMAKTILHNRLRHAYTAPVQSSAETILHAVCAEFGVTADQLVSATRTGAVAQARQVAMYLLRADGGLTYATIARELARDHSTVIHGCNRIQHAIAENDEALLSALSAVRQTVLDTLN